jgi:hypothetical protein
MRKRRQESQRQQAVSSTKAAGGESNIHSISSSKTLCSLTKCHSPVKAGNGLTMLHIVGALLGMLSMTMLLRLVFMSANDHVYSHQSVQNGKCPEQQQAKEKDASIQRFMAWFQDSGGRLAPGVTLSYFPDYGGHGLAFFMNHTDDHQLDDSKETCCLIHQGDELLRVPKEIQFYAQKSMDRLRGISVASSKEEKQVEEDLASKLAFAVQQYFPESILEQQDVVIAMQLMVECSLGDASQFVHYLDVLQSSSKSPPLRLDTFSKAELQMLQDPFLEQLALHSQRQMKMAWNHGGLSWMVAKWARHEAVKRRHVDVESNSETCLSFASFHRFAALVSSHAMILENSTKYLVPMADMINHATVTPSSSSSSEVSLDDDSKTLSSSSSPVFTDNHVRNANDGSIAVKADRIFQNGQQIFEEYGQLDNSLYLVANGFVPNHNPHHCVVIPRELLFPKTEHNYNHDDDPAFHLTRIVLPELFGSDSNEYILPSFDNICVNRRGSLQDQAASASLLIAHDLQNDSALLKKCEQSLLALGKRSPNNSNTNHKLVVAAACTKKHNGPSNKEDTVALRRILAKAAQKMMDRYPTSLQQDMSLLEKVQLVLSTRRETKDASTNGVFNLHGDVVDGGDEDDGRSNTHYEKVALALQFRIVDKQVLYAIMENAASL